MNKLGNTIKIAVESIALTGFLAVVATAPQCSPQQPSVESIDGGTEVDNSRKDTRQLIKDAGEPPAKQEMPPDSIPETPGIPRSPNFEENLRRIIEERKEEKKPVEGKEEEKPKEEQKLQKKQKPRPSYQPASRAMLA